MSGYVHHPGPERPLPPYGSPERLANDAADHNIRLVPSDPAKTHASRDEWRTECSCGWAGPPDAGQGAAAEHWLAHMRQVMAAEVPIA